MDKAAIKNFSIWARNKLIADITYKAGLLGITEEGIKDPLPQSAQDAEFYDIGTKEPYAIQGEEIKQRKQLVSVIRKKALQLEYKDAYRNVIEEVAYTWFNRLIAIRFMEVNDYMPAKIRVLSSESGTKLEPDLVTAPFDAEIEFTQQETDRILQMKNDNQVDALFRFLFIKQCNALNECLPKLFEKTSDYTELLLNVSVTDQDGIVYHLTHDIQEDDFNISNMGEDGKPTGQVEIIGWMYQYYNTEPKDETFALLKSNVKITKERIPAATQLFTPDWIVRYMVENSVGRLWLEGHENEELRDRWRYYLDEAEQEADVEEQLKAIREEYKNMKPDEIKVIDPCMGSGHILVYAFEVLMQIYESYGYSQRDAAKSIVENNIFGLDIDDRAFQLAYFAVMMKARAYNRRFLTLGIEPNLCAIGESNGILYDEEMGECLLGEEHRETLKYLLDTFVDAKEYGAILTVEERDYDGLIKEWERAEEAALNNIVVIGWYMECNQIVPLLVKQAKILLHKYNVVVTNPPYMGAGNMNSKLTQYIKKNYFNVKSDFFSVSIIRCCKFAKKNGFLGFLSPYVWMFIQSYEYLRRVLLKEKTINSLIQFEYSAFEEATVPICTFTIQNCDVHKKGSYLRLTGFRGGMETQRIKTIEAINNHKCGYYYETYSEPFFSIPGIPIAYWASDALFKAFARAERLALIANPKKGLATTDNKRFLRLWQEVEFYKVGIGCKDRNEAFASHKKWFPLNKGGEYRKWYGNKRYLVNWENDGKEMKEAVINRYHGGSYTKEIRSEDKYFRDSITWSALTAGDASFRFSDYGAVFDSAGSSMFPIKNFEFILGLVNSKVTNEILYIINPTMNYGAGSIGNIPVIENINKQDDIGRLVEYNIAISKTDWDSFETSWDFVQHPLIRCASFAMKEMQEDKKKHIKDMNYIKDAFTNWENECMLRFNHLKRNEEELNRIFIDIYGLKGELTPEVEDKDVTVRKADLSRDIRSFISYAVGCMFGRYSLDQDGLMFAGGDLKDLYEYYDGTFASAVNIPLDGKYTFQEMGTPFYYLPADGKEPLECWRVDADNIIPITDEEYFADDVVNRFVEFVKIVYGEDTLEENLDFIAQVLGNKGSSSRGVIRSYFMKDFYADHLKVYQKRPIYWLFHSGKLNGFKALIYMHRYNVDTIGNLRVDYLHRIERIYESEINRMQDIIDNSRNAREAAAASKRKEKLKKQLKECQEYDEKIGHLALSRIEIDLDDGVKVNYEKVQTARDGKKYQVLAKI